MRKLTHKEMQLFNRVALGLKVPRKVKKRIQNDSLFLYIMQDSEKYHKLAERRLIGIS